jgi:hypothetical protein
MNVRGAALWLGAFASLVTLSAAAIDFSVSGFGTVGYARSDQSYGYQRFIDDSGTFWRDSVAGLQLDARFADKFGATVQFKLAPATSSDNEFTGTVSWAFLSWRPTDDWLFRAGKQRIPLYLYSQTVDVGVTYEFARLPTEMYSIIASNDFTGLSISKSWTLDRGELALDGYWGKASAYYRFWIRDNIPPVQNAGAVFAAENFNGGGLVLSYKRNEDTYRMGVHNVRFKTRNGDPPLTTTYPYVGLAPGIGYYQVDDSIPGPGVPVADSLTANVVTLGAEVDVGYGFRVIGEVARTVVPDTDISTASTRGYAALLRRIENWTPYVIYAFLRSRPAERTLYNNVNYNTVPDFVPGAGLINASQRTGADYLPAYDQHSWSVGTSYSFSATSKLKAEFMRSHIGQMSSLVDAPPGGNVRDQNINVFSLNYNFVF